jgi:two-component system response regulator YesN
LKIVIADDERLVRISLISMINEIEASWQIVGEAANGEELLDLIREHKPNIAIVDIRMPRMSGLEAIQHGKLISPFTKWVILSGFSDFSYAQEAIKLGASAYLLKPVQPVDLERALYRTYKDNKEFVILFNQQFENSLSALCNGLLSLRQEEPESLIFQGWFIGVKILFDTAKPESKTTEIYQRLYENLRQCMNDHLIYGMNLAILSLPNGELAAIGAWDRNEGNKVKHQVDTFLDQVKQIANDCQSADLTVSLLQTDLCQGFEALNERLQHLQQWSCLRAICGIGRTIEYGELEDEAKNPEHITVGNLLCSLRHHIQGRMYLNYQNAVNELEGQWRKANLLAAESNQPAVSHFIRCTLGIDIPDQANGEQMIQALNRYGERFLIENKPKEQGSTDVIKQVIAYLEQQYMNDIGIRQIANQLNVSANYLSTLFHKKTGVMFVKYLTRIRMIKAKELLLHTNLQVKQIAEEVGYYSTRHFTKLFTEMFGSYPSDYRKIQILEKKQEN